MSAPVSAKQVSNSMVKSQQLLWKPIPILKVLTHNLRVTLIKAMVLIRVFLEPHRTATK